MQPVQPVYPVCLWQTVAALPDQDSFYDVTDSLERLGMEPLMQKHTSSKSLEPELRQQFTVYEVTLWGPERWGPDRRGGPDHRGGP